MRKKTSLFVLAFLVGAMAFSVAPAYGLFNREVPFIHGLTSSPPGLDPLNFYDTTSSDVAINHLEGLYAFDYSDPSLGLTPRLAVDMGTWNEDGDEWTIDIRTDVTWHDGTPFTADDVKWNWDRLNTIVDAGLCEHGSLWYNDDGDLMLDSTTVVDDDTITFTLTKPWTDFQLLQSFAGCYMIKPVDGKEDAIITNDEIDMIYGTGPFILDDLVAGEKTVLVANENYYQGAPDINKLIFQVFADGDTYNQAMLNKEIHSCRSVLHDNLAAFDADPDLEYHEQVGSCCYFYHLNTHNMPYAARKAIQFAFNYTYAIEVLYDNQLIEHHSPVPEGMFGYNPDIEGLPTYDLDIARQYLFDDPTYSVALAAAGIDENSTDDDWKALVDDVDKDPLDTFNFTHYGTGTWAMLIDNMKYIGIEIVDNVVGNWATFLGANLQDLEIVMGGWCPDYFAAINQIEPVFATNASANYGNLNNATLDTWMKEAHTLTGDDLQDKIDQIVKGIIVDNGAAMYFMQSVETIGWYSGVVSNVDDLFNASYDKYFYNVVFTADDNTRGIPGYAVGTLLAATLGTAALIIRKRK